MIKATLQSILSIVVLGLATPALTAQQAPVLVELFTSQGCNSCPPADRVLGNLAVRDDVVALAYHVTYWDRLGWPDTFGQEIFNRRQNLYAERFNSRTVYTPQAVIAGQIDVVGSNMDRIELAIQLVHAEGRAVGIEIDPQGQANLPAVRSDGPIEIWMAAYRASEQVRIERGENAGQTLTYHHVVRSWQSLGAWSGNAATKRLDLEAFRAEGLDGIVLVAQDQQTGAILALGESAI